MGLSITADWERLEAGSPEERAGFAAIRIAANDKVLSEAEDAFVNRVRTSVHLSSYRLAEWLAWNWWRQLYEPRRESVDWKLAHRMATVGGGYVWPNITIVSDGERVALVAKPTAGVPTEPLRYLSDWTAVMPVAEYSAAVSGFIEQVLEQLRQERVTGSNLASIWSEVRAERADPGLAKRRRLEALLGCDPDEADEAAIDGLLVDEQRVGFEMVGELAAMASAGEGVISLGALEAMAYDLGADVDMTSAVRLSQPLTLPRSGMIVAWKRGAAAARALRAQELLADVPIDNRRLADMSGVVEGMFSQAAHKTKLSFLIGRAGRHGRMVVRSKWETGRRFDVARLLGDRIEHGEGKLFAATASHTYRQKMQRAFAAELLCPVDAISAMLGEDRSVEGLEEVARHFKVSSLTVQTQLLNNGLIARENTEPEFVDLAV
jgi:hypothetical protein